MALKSGKNDIAENFIPIAMFALSDRLILSETIFS